MSMWYVIAQFISYNLGIIWNQRTGNNYNVAWYFTLVLKYALFFNSQTQSKKKLLTILYTYIFYIEIMLNIL